jgi:glycosyltransferase involved in cell wall biosynthesis
MAKSAGRILLNDNIRSHAAQRGAARYFEYVTDGLIAHFGSQIMVCSPVVRDYGAAQYIRTPRFPGSGRLGMHDLSATMIAHIKHPALIFSPYYGSVRTRIAQIFTVYDMIPEMINLPAGQDDSRILKAIAEKKRCFERAAALLAISNSTARDILSVYPHLHASMIKVIPLGVDTFFFERSQVDNRAQAKPYFLYVGNRGGHKNFRRLLTAYGQSGLASAFDLRVISPGHHAFSTDEVDCIRSFQLEASVQLRSAVSETELRESYASAVALVYPSEYEGFGLPILEAMASGTLVATSNVSSMPEVGGNVAFYFDPRNSETIVETLKQMTYLSIVERQRRIAQGVVHARTFTWEQCQYKTIKVVEELLLNRKITS